MAEKSEKPENKASLKQDDLIAKLVKDPKAPPDALLLSGLVGASSEEGHSRLYLNGLEDYVEIPNDAILHTREIPKDQSPLGGSLVWIKSDAELIHGKVGPNRLKAKFLEGRIQQEFVKARAAAGVPGQPGVPLVTLPDAPGCRTEFGPACPTFAPGFCPSHVPIGCPTNPAACTHAGLQCHTHQFECTRFGPTCPHTVVPSACPTCAGCPTHPPICPPPTLQPPCTHAGPQCPTFGPTILQCCQPSLVIPCPSHPVNCTIVGLQCRPSILVPGCTHAGPECPIHTIAPPCPPHTVAPPCPVASGFVCGGLGGSAACQPGGPVQVGPIQAAAHFAAGQQFQPSVQCLTVQACSVAGNCPTTDGACTVVGLNCPSQQGICTAIDPNCVMPTQQFPCAQTPMCPPTQNLACPTHHVGCTVDIRACINTVNPQQCPVQSAACPTPHCPTHHVVACTIGGPACGVTGPHCPVVSAFCPPTPACPTQNQLACHPSVVVQCPTLQVIHCPVPSVQRLHCGPSVVEICPTLRLDCLPSQGIHICPSHPAILCGGASGGFGCGPQGPGPLNPGGGFANAAAFGAMHGAQPEFLQIKQTILCPQPHTLMACPTQDIIACHPTLLCPSRAACPTAFAFCPSLFCGFGGFGGINQF